MSAAATSGASPGAGATASATPSPLPRAQAAALAALLAAEQAAVYAFGVVGGQAAESARPAALVALQRHAARRDLLAGRLSAAGQRPEPADPAYGLPFPVDGPASARALAAHVETVVAEATADLVRAAARRDRVEAARWLAETYLAARAWGAAPTAFPGLAERAGDAGSTSSPTTPSSGATSGTGQPRTTS